MLTTVSGSQCEGVLILKHEINQRLVHEELVLENLQLLLLCINDRVAGLGHVFERLAVKLIEGSVQGRPL